VQHEGGGSEEEKHERFAGVDARAPRAMELEVR
jgi:hypothetical protein